MDMDTLFFFDGRPAAMEIYTALEEKLRAAFPDVRVKVQKTQISFGNKYGFAFASLPRRKNRTGGLSDRFLRSGRAGGIAAHFRENRDVPQPLDAPCGGILGGGARRGADGLDPGSIRIFGGEVKKAPCFHRALCLSGMFVAQIRSRG